MGVSSGGGFTSEVMAAALRSIYRREFDLNRELEAHLYTATADIFREAAGRGMAAAVERGAPLPDVAFREALAHSADVFAAFRTHRMQNDIAARLTDGSGRLKPFAQFARDVQPYVSHQNRAWLRTEYDTAVRRAQLASEWRQFEAERDVLPNLRWEESVSIHPGRDHKVFWGTVRPIDDPFWSQHRPGDRWNCKCSLEATDEPPTDAPQPSSPADNPAPGLENNPGSDGALFSDRHPYFPKGCTACPYAKSRLFALFSDLAARKDCMACAKVNEAIQQTDPLGFNADSNRKEFRKKRRDLEKELKKLPAVKIDDSRIYSGHLYLGSDDMAAVLSHCYNGLELEAARRLRELVRTIKDGRYAPLDMGRHNIQKKLDRGVLHYVAYEVEVEGYRLELKCEVRNSNGIVQEHPYSLKIPKGE